MKSQIAVYFLMIFIWSQNILNYVYSQAITVLK